MVGSDFGRGRQPIWDAFWNGAMMDLLPGVLRLLEQSLEGRWLHGGWRYSLGNITLAGTDPEKWLKVRKSEDCVGV